jgi:hypothetical protein
MLLGIVTALGYCAGGNLGQCLVSKLSLTAKEEDLFPLTGSLYYGFSICRHMRCVSEARANHIEFVDWICLHPGNHAATGRWLVEEKRAVARVL